MGHFPSAGTDATRAIGSELTNPAGGTQVAATGALAAGAYLVGFLVSASTRTLAALGAIGEEVTLHTEMQVSDDAIRLIAQRRYAARNKPHALALAVFRAPLAPLARRRVGSALGGEFRRTCHANRVANLEDACP